MEKRSAEGKQAKIEYIREYNRANYENITLTVKKGERKRYKELAGKAGLNLTQLFLRAVDEYEQNHGNT